MISRILKTFIIFIFLSSCGYTPIFSNSSNTNININIVRLDGEKHINSLLEQQLNRYKNSAATKNYDLEIRSEYNKSILTKDTAGNATNFRLKMLIDIETIIDGTSKKINFEETFDMKKESTTFAEENYEKLIQRDMINLIVQKIILQLM